MNSALIQEYRKQYERANGEQCEVVEGYVVSRNGSDIAYTAERLAELTAALKKRADLFGVGFGGGYV